jgi:hypothetical protein
MHFQFIPPLETNKLISREKIITQKREVAQLGIENTGTAILNALTEVHYRN